MPQKTIFLVVLVMALVSNTSAQDTVRGTVVVVALTEHGVVLGSDHLRQITSMSDPAENELKRLDVPKFLQCGPDIVCSSAGLAEMEIECSFESPLGVRKGGHLKYSSYNWIPQIQDDGTNTGQASPKRLAELIWEKARSTFDPIECFMRTKEGSSW